MTETPRAYRAICFDLDGTLLPMDLGAFMQSYFEALYDFMTVRGIDGGAFLEALKRGTRAMATHDDGSTNEEAFWGEFHRHMDPDAADWEALLAEFYEGPFGKLGESVQPNPETARALEVLQAKGYPLVLTTMPMFPPQAVRWRLAWAGADADAFARLTTYDNSTTVKPHPRYYAENAAALGVAPEDILMVGNNTVEDLAFAELGADAFLVTDWLLDPTDGFDLSTVRHGTMADFARWVEALPPCANPARDINAGTVAAADAEAVLAACATAGDAQAAAARYAAAKADAAPYPATPGADAAAGEEEVR